MSIARNTLAQFSRWHILPATPGSGVRFNLPIPSNHCLLRARLAGVMAIEVYGYLCLSSGVAVNGCRQRQVREGFNLFANCCIQVCSMSSSKRELSLDVIGL